jgi:hypothetical protein
MSFENQNPDPVATDAEQQRLLNTLPDGPLSAAVLDTMQDSSIAALDPHMQGAVIADRFIGTLVAEGSISGRTHANESYSPGDVLWLMDQSSTDPRARGAMTTNAGMRKAIFTMEGDDRTGPLFGHMAERIKEKDGIISLTTLDQLSGYLAVFKAPNEIDDASAWRNALLEETSDFAHDPYRPGRWNTDEILGADNDQLRAGQQEYEAAERIAEASGVDMELIKRSAHEMREKLARSEHIGDIAVAGAAGNRFIF